MMRPDIRETSLYKEAEDYYNAVRQPGTGRISDASEVDCSPDGRQVLFSATLMSELEGVPTTRICRIELASQQTQVLTFGPNSDRLPRFSPNGLHVAFLSDRRKAGDFQLYLLDLDSGGARSTSCVEGWVEYFHWSPDGLRILLGVAKHGADVSGGEGAVASTKGDKIQPSWMPIIESGDQSCRWRRAWVYEVATGKAYPIGPPGYNVWEAAWAGNDAVAAVVSSNPGEAAWYTARLGVLSVDTERCREIYLPQDQLGLPAASPSGSHLSVVEAVCSDRLIVAGDLLLIETVTGEVQRLDTRGIDVTYTEWLSDCKLLLAGHRGFETVVAVCDRATGIVKETWSSKEVTTAGRYVSVSGLNETGDCVMVGESYVRAPEIAVIRTGQYQVIQSLDISFADQVSIVGAVERVSWHAPDGLEILGYLLRPKAQGPYPLVMYIHGGPVWHWRPTWLGRGGAAAIMLLRRGCAVFYPNPRGSGGRGQDFARRVKGDMNGAETYDYLSGLDALVRRGVADPGRIGVTGGSYGGNMTAWLITQDSRFSAAVAVAAHTNQVTERLISNIPHFVDMFLADKYNNPGGKYFQRSPIMYANQVKTPTLSICGMLDRCTPPEESIQFHHALLENGIESVLVTYPEEGHGIRRFPAAIDFAARVVGWFEKHMTRPI